MTVDVWLLSANQAFRSSGRGYHFWWVALLVACAGAAACVVAGQEADREPHTGPDYLRRAQLLSDHGKYEEAIAVLHKALSLPEAAVPEGAATLHAALGLVNSDKGDLEEAAAQYESALDLAPHLEKIPDALARVRGRIARKRSDNGDVGGAILVIDRPDGFSGNSTSKQDLRRATALGTGLHSAFSCSRM